MDGHVSGDRSSRLGPSGSGDRRQGLRPSAEMGRGGNVEEEKEEAEARASPIGQRRRRLRRPSYRPVGYSRVTERAFGAAEIWTAAHMRPGCGDMGTCPYAVSEGAGGTIERLFGLRLAP